MKDELYWYVNRNNSGRLGVPFNSSTFPRSVESIIDGIHYGLLIHLVQLSIITQLTVIGSLILMAPLERYVHFIGTSLVQSVGARPQSL